MLLAGRYRVMRRLGAGGMGEVLLAEDERLGRRVAIKRLHPHGDEAMARRLRREARIGASLSHPNLVRVYDVELVGAELMIVMEYVDGETLAQAIRGGPLPRERALDVLRGVAAALDHAHEAGVTHRDVKPSNVLCSTGGAVKLADLGIAVSVDSSVVTRSGAALGSVSYMAPEQLAGERATRATDVHGLATVAFELLAGRRARSGGELQIADSVARGEVPDLRDAWPEAPEAAAEVLRRGMAIDPADRPPSAGALVDELARALGAEREAPAVGGADAAAPEPDAPRPRRRPGRSGAAAALLAGLLAAVFIVALLPGGGGEGDGGDAERAGTSATTPAGRSQGEGGEGTAMATAPAPAPAPDAGEDGGPAATVREFYGRAARQDADGVCSLMGPRLRARFSCAEFTGQFRSLRAVDVLRSAEQRRAGRTATVQIATTARHISRTDRCRGTVGLVREGDGWLVDELDVSCSPG